MSQSDEILIYLKKNKNRLLKEYRLTKIGVFGSVAHSKDSEKSDIDLIVEFEKKSRRSLCAQAKTERRTKKPV